MAFLILMMLAGVAVLLVQLASLRSESSAANQRALAEIHRVATDGATTRALLMKVTEALNAAPAAARSLSAPDALPALTRGLTEIAEQFRSTREEMSRSALAVCDALEQATEEHLEAVEEFEARGNRLVAGMVGASGELGRVAAELRSSTEASAELHETLQANAVSFQMVQELIQRLGELLPQVAVSTQSLSRLIERVEEKNLFGEAVFSQFEGSLRQLSDAVVDLAALSRTFASQLDHQPQRVALAPAGDEGSPETLPSEAVQ